MKNRVIEFIQATFQNALLLCADFICSDMYQKSDIFLTTPFIIKIKA